MAGPPRSEAGSSADGHPVQVVLYVADPHGAPGSVEAAYHRISRALHGTPGLVRNSLLRSVADPGAFAVLSEWKDMAAFRDWEEGSGHRDLTAPLRPLQNARSSSAFCVYEVTASYPAVPDDRCPQPGGDGSS